MDRNIHYIYNRDNGIKIECHPEDKTIQYFDSNGNSHTYHPDFYIVETKELIEIKGINQFYNKDRNGKMICPHDRNRDDAAESKHKCMIANNVKILVTEDYQVYIDYVNMKYGRNYLKQFRVKNKNNCK